MNQRVKKKLVIIILIGAAIVFSGCSLVEKGQQTRALFSWKASEVLEGHTEIFETMKKHQLNTLYQEVSEELEEKDVLDFLVEAKKEKIDVYMLAGSPDWALDESGESMHRQLNRVLEINSKAGENQGIKGVLFDVEPYLLETWEEQSSEEIMDTFVKSMKKVYEKAKKNGLEMIICIPYFYDNLGFSEQLEDLIRSGCGSVAIMNYYQGKEYENIQLEVELADKYEKGIINIYELQAAGKHDLKDKNTYHEEGIKAVEENFKELQEKLSGKDISIAFHEYRALKELLGSE